MVTQILIKKGLEANRLGITPAVGEMLWITDTQSVYVGDGLTPGGILVASAGGVGDFIPVAEKAAADGVATLGPDGLIPNDQLPALAITQTYTAADEAEQLALTVQEGDVCVRTDESKSYIALNETNGSMADWQELLTPTDSVISVNGKTGVVVLTTDDIAEGTTNLYYTDERVNNAIINYLANTIDDTAGVGATDKVWSADKIATEMLVVDGGTF